MEIIYKLKSGISLNELKREMVKISEQQIKKGSQAIIAGCTEIPLILKKGNIYVPVIDPTFILAKRAVEKANIIKE